MEARYEALGINGALRRSCDYAEACSELVTLLKDAYLVAHKSLQTCIFQDVMAAIRRLPEMRASADFSAAYALAQAADSKLPKQKRSMVATEYKTAAIGWQRGLKHQTDGVCTQLPQDLVPHLFSFLDVYSLGVAACVCRSWNAASKEDSLWRKQLVFGLKNSLIDTRILQHAGFKFTYKGSRHSCRLRDVSIEKEGCWRDAFRLGVKSLSQFARVQSVSSDERAASLAEQYSGRLN